MVIELEHPEKKGKKSSDESMKRHPGNKVMTSHALSMIDGGLTYEYRMI